VRPLNSFPPLDISKFRFKATPTANVMRQTKVSKRFRDGPSVDNEQCIEDILMALLNKIEATLQRIVLQMN
jgi:hypothetical protein